MVRLLALLLSLWSGAAFAQATFVTQSNSPWGVNGGVTVNGTTTVSLTNGLPTIVTSPVAGSIPVSANITGTVSVSPIAGTYPVIVTGTPTVSLTTSTTVFASLSAGLPTLVTSSVGGGNTPVTTLNTVTTSPVAGGTYPVNVGNTVTSSLTAGTITSLAVGSPTVTNSQSTVGLNSEEGLGYLNRANWFSQSVSTASATTTVLVNQSGTNKAYVTGIQCSRSDTTTQMVLLGFNNVSSGTSLYIRLPSVSAPGEGNAAQVTVTFYPPSPTAASTSLQFTPTAVVSGSFNCNAQGYYAG